MHLKTELIEWNSKKRCKKIIESYNLCKFNDKKKKKIRMMNEAVLLWTQVDWLA